MYKSKLFVTTALLFASTFANAAIDPKAPSVPTAEALSLPLGNRLLLLREQGPQAYRNLVKIMEDEKQTMEMRWRAVTAIGRIGKNESKPELEKALNSKQWFMRNAGLVAMAEVDREAAVDWSRKLLNDKALMVRTAAVETLASLRDSTSNRILWSKLYSPQNFRRKQSLFIRRKIVETLAVLESRGAESQFVQILQDKDESLHKPAIHALERLTQRKLGSAAEKPELQRERWISWWKETSASKAL